MAYVASHGKGRLGSFSALEGPKDLSPACIVEGRDCFRDHSRAGLTYQFMTVAQVEFAGLGMNYIGTGTLSTISRKICSACSDFLKVEA